jgi:hypothetical protein
MKLFNRNIIQALPMVSNRRVFTRLTLDESVTFFKDLTSKLDALADIKAKTNSFEDLTFDLSTFSKGEPCSMVKLLYEKQIISDYRSTLLFEGKIELGEFMRPSLFEVHPYLKKTFDEPVFQEFYHKYCLIMKELVFKCLRNPARQRRAIPKYYEDFNVLLNEANYCDEVLLKASGQKNTNNTIALAMTINAALLNSLELLNKGIEL